MQDTPRQPTDREWRDHLVNGASNECLVCGLRLVGEFTDYNGQFYCTTCGTTYQTMGSHLADDCLERLGLKREQVARTYCDCFAMVRLLKAYWNGTRRRMPLGAFIGSRPWAAEDAADFNLWLNNHAHELRGEFEDCVNWDGLSRWCAAHLGNHASEGI